MAEYELWLTDDAGRRILSLNGLSEPFFFSYTRVVSGLGTFSFGVPFAVFKDKVKPYFVPDQRIEVWRSPAVGIPMRREDSFMLRKPNIYTRADNVEVIQFYGRNGIDLLNRSYVIQRAGTSYASKTDFIDDMMKAIVREQMLYGSAINRLGNPDNTSALPQNEFFVQGDLGFGPTLSLAFPDRKVFDILKDLHKASVQFHDADENNRVIHFDVVPRDLDPGDAPSGARVGWEFRTYADLRGTDRTGGMEFSRENENLSQPSYSISHLDEINSVIVRGNGSGANQLMGFVQDVSRVSASRWNRCEKVISATSTTDFTGLNDAGRAELSKGRPREEMFATLLNNPGGEDVPRSLYGVDWDLGDRVRVNYADKQFEAEINVVYVSVDDSGKEEITGRNEIQAV